MVATDGVTLAADDQNALDFVAALPQRIEDGPDFGPGGLAAVVAWATDSALSTSRRRDGDVADELRSLTGQWPSIRSEWEREFPGEARDIRLPARADRLLYVGRLAWGRADDLDVPHVDGFRKRLATAIRNGATGGSFRAEAVREILMKSSSTRALLEEEYPDAIRPLSMGGHARMWGP